MADHIEVPEEAVEALYESMHGLYRPWRRLEPKKKAGWVKALQAAAPIIRKQERQRVREAVSNDPNLLVSEYLDSLEEADA